jgi:hypothetical protein
MASNQTLNPGIAFNQTSNAGQKSCCWSEIMSLQSDFNVNERPVIEDLGHVCLFLPKFHCELDPIELFWSYIKQCQHKFIDSIFCN